MWVRTKIEERSAVGSTAMISPDFHILFISLSWKLLGETKISKLSIYTRSKLQCSTVQEELLYKSTKAAPQL